MRSLRKLFSSFPLSTLSPPPRGELVERRARVGRVYGASTRKRKTWATTWQQEPPPRFSLPGNKRAEHSSHPGASKGSASDNLPARPRVARLGGAAEAAPAGPAPSSLFSRQEGGLLATRHLQTGPLLPHKSPRDNRPATASSADKRSRNHLSLSSSPQRAAPPTPGPTHLPAGRPGSGTPAVPWSRANGRALPADPRASRLGARGPSRAPSPAEHTRASVRHSLGPAGVSYPAMTARQSGQH
ncbi:translation initiation factor IF-2-like [Trachypithecus francoisi]|uniref:translation initiation factor IF-2-like n=1 Tax=Trachypithecus francoisi TaxID=54180 RepID=UPI00141ADD99|nr:translation initiation factor IF-2-like [Trachypithecus francoisi]